MHTYQSDVHFGLYLLWKNPGLAGVAVPQIIVQYIYC